MDSTGTLVPRWRAEAAFSEAGEGVRPVLIDLETPVTSMRGHVLSISSTHAEILPEISCYLFSRVYAQIRFRLGDTPFLLTGSVVSCEGRRTLVLEFDRATRTNMTMLRNLGLRKLGPPPIPNAESRPSSPALAPKRSKAEQKTVLHATPAEGAERRGAPRFDLDTDASLHFPETGSVMQCKLLEISRSGCRLFSETPFHLKADTRVEVDFIAKGCPYRIAAAIRPKNDEHLTGLEFMDLTARRKTILGDLIDELREASQSKGAG